MRVDKVALNQKEMRIKAISKVCHECGVSARVLTMLKQVGNPPTKLCHTVSTYHTARCDVCMKTKSVTQPRDFFYPDFTLLLKVMQKFNAKRQKEISKAKV